MTPEDISGLRRELVALHTRVEELRNAIREHSAAIHTAQEAQQHAQEAGKPVPVIVAYNDQTVGDAKAEQDRQYDIHKSVRNWTKAAVIAATIYAAVAALQLVAMRQANSLTGKVIQNAVNFERPWVGISFSTSNWADANSPAASATVFFINSGRRPARAITTQFSKGDFVTFPKDPPYESHQTDVHSVVLILPSASSSNTEPIPQLTPDRLQNLIKNKETFFIYATIQYEDVLTHVMHWTHGCIQYLPHFQNAGGGFVSCASYNEIDTEEAADQEERKAK